MLSTVQSNPGSSYSFSAFSNIFFKLSFVYAFASAIPDLVNSWRAWMNTYLWFLGKSSHSIPGTHASTPFHFGGAVNSDAVDCSVFLSAFCFFFLASSFSRLDFFFFFGGVSTSVSNSVSSTLDFWWRVSVAGIQTSLFSMLVSTRRNHLISSLCSAIAPVNLVAITWRVAQLVSVFLSLLLVFFQLIDARRLYFRHHVCRFIALLLGRTSP